MPNLFSLFDEKLKKPNDLVANEPQNLDSIAAQVEEQELILKKIKQFETVRPKVDYSDFANFVFFNSALDYFNITGELILNQYPYDGTVDQIEAFLDDLDDYQRYVVENEWPTASGHLRFNPTVANARVEIDDLGVDSGGSAQSALLSPGTGSWTVEFWAVPPPTLTGSNDTMVVLQKVNGNDGYTAYYSGSNIFFRMASSSFTDEVNAVAIPGQVTHFTFVYDKGSSTLSAMTGSAVQFPVVVTSASLTAGGNLFLGTSRMLLGSGSLTGKLVRPLTGSLDNLRIWNTPRSLLDLSSSFNTKIYGQKNLIGLWRFNETALTASGDFTVPKEQNTVVLDYSGHRLHGKIQNYQTDIRGSGSLIPYETSDLVVSFDAAEVRDYIADKQLSGTIYDKDNDNNILRLLPDQYFQLEAYKETDVLEKFLYVLARQFDYTKIRIDQFLHIMKSHYGEHDQTPDALLPDIGKFFGWEFTGNFLNSSASQYILGKNVLSGLESNKQLDQKLYEIKNEFWRRTLINLMYLYKTKGTRESIESLLRIYGVNKNFVRLKEYGIKPNVGVQTFRISSEKSVPTLAVTGSAYVLSMPFSSSARTIESRVRFPTSISSVMPASLATGSIWTLNSSGSMTYQLYFTKPDPTSLTGSLILTSSHGQLVLSGANIFDSNWYNIAVTRDYQSSSLGIQVRAVTDGEVTTDLETYVQTSLSSGSRRYELWVGSTGSLKSEQWMQEVRVWDQPLSDIELEDHALNFQSFGSEDVNGLVDLRLHWRLAENVTSSAGGALYGQIIDVSSNNVTGSGYSFAANTNPYRKFLNEFNYIAPPDYGWNEEKIRIMDSSAVPAREHFNDDPTLALEFNMVDALNEDISQILATMDSFNNAIGLPANRYREEYPDLAVLRENYFKRLSGRLNFRVFFDMLEFFDRSFVDMVKRLIPARAVFLGEEFVVESHMLERPKVRWNYRRQEKPFEPEGTIKVFIRS